MVECVSPRVSSSAHEELNINFSVLQGCVTTSSASLSPGRAACPPPVLEETPLEFTSATDRFCGFWCDECFRGEGGICCHRFGNAAMTFYKCRRLRTRCKAVLGVSRQDQVDRDYHALVRERQCYLCPHDVDRESTLQTSFSSRGQPGPSPANAGPAAPSHIDSILEDVEFLNIVAIPLPSQLCHRQ